MGDVLEFKRPNQSTNSITLKINASQSLPQYNDYTYKPSFTEKVKEKCLDGICAVICFFIPMPSVEDMLFPENENADEQKAQVYGK